MVTFQSFTHQEVQGFEFGYHPFSKPILTTIIYYVDGLLIDTGQRKAQKQILENTNKLQIDQIFITHHHEDHTGNIEVLQKKHNCSVFASEECVKLMRTPPAISWAQKLTWGDRPSFGQIQKVGSKLITRKHEFEIIPIPGHAQDMVALYEPHKKWLFSADLYINSYIGYFLYNESISDQITSLKRVLELDFEVLFCNHNPKFNNPKKALNKKLRFLEDFFQKVKTQHDQGKNASQIFKYLRLKEDHFVKILSGGDLSKMNMVKSAVRDIENN